MSFSVTKRKIKDNLTKETVVIERKVPLESKKSKVRLSVDESLWKRLVVGLGEGDDSKVWGQQMTLSK